MESIIVQLAILVMSVVIHEFSHGAIAYIMGDPTAKYMGRLTLNPLKHLDPIGSFFVPVFLFLISGGNGPIFGWAKPVPYNPHNLRNQKYGSAIVGFAGPGANLLVALFFGLLIRFLGPYEITLPIMTSFLNVVSIIVLINLLLAIFNLVPIPPLDGSKILFDFLPLSMREIRFFLERYGFLLLIFFIFFLFQFVIPIISILYFFITGQGFSF